MKITKFAIELDNTNSRSFFPGQTISGKVIIVSKKEKAIKGLELKCWGKAKVRWTDNAVESTGKGSDRKEERKTVVYQNEEEYFHYELNLLGNDKSQRVVPQGSSSHPFKIVLPQGLPSSYVGKSGQVFYQLQASLDRKGKQPLVTKLPFTVNGILDLNKEPGADQPSEQRKYKYLCCLFCRSGPVGFVFHIPKKGFVPGERLKFVVEMNNQSNRKINRLSMALVQSVMFHAKGNSKQDLRIIRQLKGPSLEPGDDGIWSDTLKIPPIPPTRLANCRIIDVQYTIQIELDVSGIAVNLKGELPIIIGTIPHRQNFAELTQARMLESNGDTEIVDQSHAISAVLNEYPDLPPPSYAQAMELEERGKGRSSTPNAQYAYKSGSKTSLNTLLVPEDSDDIDLSYVPTYITYG